MHHNQQCLAQSDTFGFFLRTQWWDRAVLSFIFVHFFELFESDFLRRMSHPGPVFSSDLGRPNESALSCIVGVHCCRFD